MEMNRCGRFDQNFRPWGNHNKGRIRGPLDNNNPFNGVPQRFRFAAHPNNFRNPFHDPRFPQPPNYNNGPPRPPCPLNRDVRLEPPRPLFGHPSHQRQGALKRLHPHTEMGMHIHQDHPNNFRHHMPSPFQNPFQVDTHPRPSKSPLLPLPRYINEHSNNLTVHVVNHPNHSFQQQGARRPDLDQDHSIFAKRDIICNEQPVISNKGYVTVKTFSSDVSAAEKDHDVVPTNPATKNNVPDQWTRTSPIVNNLKRKDKFNKRLNEYPQLPVAAHDVLHFMDEDTEILAYFDAEMRLFHRKSDVMKTSSHVVFTKPSEQSLTWILAFSKHILLKGEPRSNILSYRRAINRFISLKLLNNRSISLRSEEYLDEHITFYFKNFQECRRFQDLFFQQKSLYDMKRPCYDEAPSNIFEKRYTYNGGSILSESASESKPKPVAWITKLPPEIAKFHASPETQPEAKKIRSSDEFVYDSSTFNNALNTKVGEKVNFVGDGEGNWKNSFNKPWQSSPNNMHTNDGDEIFTAQHVCLLMKRNPDSVDYRSPGFGTLSIIKNANNYNQLDFTDSSGILKCRHYIDNLNIVQRKSTPGEEDCCVWQAFAELINSPTIQCAMHFKVILPPADISRFMEAMDDSIAKANRLDRFGSWDSTISKENTHSSSSTNRVPRY